MAFILTKNPRRNRLECEPPIGDVFYLTYREMTEDERGKFDLEHAKCRHRPGDKPEDSARRFDLLLEQTAAALLVDWENVKDEDGEPVELTGDASRVFHKDAETRKYWRPYIFRYLWPATRSAEGKKSTQEAIAPEGEQSLDPQFF